jgi:sugar-specific transcriptional regulator TrmB
VKHMISDQDELIRILSEEVGLSPYEARAYVAVLYYGPLTPKGVNQKSGIPRPRTYDVLNSLVGKGLLMEQPGKPSKYLAVDPGVGLKKLMEDLETKAIRQVKQQWESVGNLVASLSGPYEVARDSTLEEEIIWVTRRDSALIAKYCEAIRNAKHGFTVATASPNPANKETLQAVRDALKKKKSSRIIRKIGSNWSNKDLEEYEELIELGDDIRYLDYDGLTFAVFDMKDIVLWLPPYPSTRTVWIKLPELAEILTNHFEVLWEKGTPAKSILQKLKREK